MQYFVFRNDECWELGGLGFEVFDTEEGALKHIEERIAATGAELSAYTVIRGEALRVEGVEQVTRIKVREG